MEFMCFNFDGLDLSKGPTSRDSRAQMIRTLLLFSHHFLFGLSRRRLPLHKSHFASFPCHFLSTVRLLTAGVSAPN